MFRTLSLTLCLVAVAACSRQDADSELMSPYPPDYSWGERCADSAEFFVCRSVTNSASIMRIYYKGMLKDSATEIYLKVNGHDARFPLDRTQDGDPEVKLANGSYSCRTRYDQDGFDGYDCLTPTDAMRHVLFYAQSQGGSPNALDIELAATDGAGNWDSRFGANYRYRLERPY